MGMTRVDIRTEVRMLLKEALAVFWTDVLLNRLIGDALDVYASRTECRTREKMTNGIALQEDYLLDADFVEPILVDGLLVSPNYYVIADRSPLQWLPLPTYQLIKGYGAAANLGTKSQFFTYFNGGGNTIGHRPNLKLLPTPLAGVNNLVIGYAAKVPPLSVDTDVPQIPSEDHEALAWHAAAVAFLQRGQTEEAAVYQTLFDRRIAERLPATGGGGGGNGATG